MFFTFPLEAHVARFAIEEVWGAYQESRGRPPMRFWWPRHLIITASLVLIAMITAIIVGDNLGVVLEFSGAVNAVAISLILPPLAYLKVHNIHLYI